MRVAALFVLAALAACDTAAPPGCPAPGDGPVPEGRATYVRGGGLGPTYRCPTLLDAAVRRDGSDVVVEATSDTLRLSYGAGGSLELADYRGRDGVPYTARVTGGALDAGGLSGRFEVEASEYGALFPVRFTLRGRFALPGRP